MAIRIRTLDEMHEVALAYARALNPAINTAPRSGFWFRSRAVAAIAMGANNAAAYLLKQVFPSDAEKTYLEKHASVRGISRRSATKARGKLVVATTTPTNASPTVNIPSGTTYTHASGLVFTVLGAATTAKPSWTGKTAAYGSSAKRVVLNPDASSMSVDQAFTLDGESYVIRAVLPDTGTALVVDPYYQPGADPGVGAALAAINTAVLEVECTTTGEAGNLPPGTSLSISSGITNLSPVGLVLEMTGGADDADDAELRSRVLAYMQERPGSGNRADYREWARETPDVGVIEAFVYPAYRGLGTVDVVCFGPPGSRALGSAANALVLAHLESRSNGQDDILVRQLAEDAENVTLAITPGEGYEPDWTGTITTSGTSTTTTLSCAASSTYDTIEIGDRVLVQSTVAGRSRLEQREVIGKSGTTLTLDEPLLASPTTGSTVWPGGPLAQPVIDAIDEYFDALGPGDISGGTRYPAMDVTGDAVLRVAKLEAVVCAVTGVLDVSISAPASNVAPLPFARPSLGVLTITHA